VALPLLYQTGQHKKSKSQIKQQVDNILKQVGIDHRANHLPQQLSGGQQQRVAVARALIINPKLILADEPTGNLDSKNGQEVMTMLQQLNSHGTTVIMVTHSPTDAKYANRIVNLFDGKITSDQAKLMHQQTASNALKPEVEHV
jgi:putative ABC transport system ATP-binding protein